MIELIRKKCKQGDIVKITLDGGREITGALDEISSEHLTLMVDKNPVVLTHKIIVLFEIVKKMEISQPATIPVPDQILVKPIKSEITPSDKADKLVSDNSTPLIQPAIKIQKKTKEFTVELLTNYNEALSYCSYLDDFDICNKVTSLDFKHGNPTEPKNNLDKKLMRLSAIYDEFKKDPDLDSIQPAVAEINSLYADNPGNANVAWKYFILSCINGDHDTAFNCLHTYALKSANTDLKSWQDYYIHLIGQTRLYEKLEELIRHCKSMVNENNQLVDFSRKALSYMLYKSKMNTAIESALGIDGNNLLKTISELIDKVPRRSIYPSTHRSPRQTQQRKPSGKKTQTQTGQFFSLTEEINFAVNNSDIKAVDSLYERYKSRSDATKLNQIGTAYQRLGQYHKAIEIFNYGLQHFPDKEVGFITSRVQLYELQGDWSLASSDYSRLLIINGDTESKRKNYNFQKARVLLKDRKISEARKILFDLSKKYPSDSGVANALAEVDRVTEDIASGGDQTDEIPIIDIGDDQVEIISPMLRFDIDECDYRDENIIKQGNKPTVEDAFRLKNNAVYSTKDQIDMSERYPLFLEAAKAFNDLTPGSYDQNDLYELLARYAALRAGSIFSEVKKLLLAPGRKLTTDTAQLKADTASSYYFESVNLQSMTNPENMLLPLTNNLKLQHNVLLYKLNEIIEEKSFSGLFNDIYRKCVESDNKAINEIAYKAIITIGSTNIDAWNALTKVNSKTKVMRELFKPLAVKSQRAKPYEYLSQLSGVDLTLHDPPGEALKKVFMSRREQTKQLAEILMHRQLYDFKPSNIAFIEKTISEMDKYKSVFFETDILLITRLNNIINVFKPYEERTPNEKVSIIVKVRSEIFSLLDFIEINPTYWGRVAFYPILRSWKQCILKLESERIKSVIPNLSISIDPQVYRRDGTSVIVNIVVRNIGQATTDKYAINVQMLDKEDGIVLDERSIDHGHELYVEGQQYHRYVAPNVSDHYSQSLFVIILPSFTYQGNENTQEAVSYTISPEDSFDLCTADIKWSYTNIPDKHMFKGRERDISKLVNHIQSPERALSYILYGLTRTGKTSILMYLESELLSHKVTINNEPRFLLPIRWNLDQAAAQYNAADLWRYFINTTIIDRLDTFRETEKHYELLPRANRTDKPKFKDLGELLLLLSKSGFYPVFLVDEFSHIILMIRKKMIDASFLAQIRSYALEGKASFIFAGTYDINDLVTKPEFGITGQFVNVLKMKVSKINEDAAADIIKAMGDKLQFTNYAIRHILSLSYCIPYFIQIICYYCAKYALENEIKYIGYPEVEEVVKVLCGESDSDMESEIQRLGAEKFSNNLLSSADPPETSVLLTTIAHSKSDYSPYHELVRIWGEHRISGFQQLLAQTLSILEEKEILLKKEEDGELYFKISVGLFERWLRKEFPILSYELDKLPKIN